MGENDIRSKVLRRNTSVDLTALDYIEAEEAGLSEACELHEHGSAGAGLKAINKKRSGYQQRQQETEQM